MIEHDEQPYLGETAERHASVARIDGQPMTPGEDGLTHGDIPVDVPGVTRAPLRETFPRSVPEGADGHLTQAAINAHRTDDAVAVVASSKED